MKNKRSTKILSLVLALIMVLSLFPVPAYAATRDSGTAITGGWSLSGWWDDWTDWFGRLTRGKKSMYPAQNLTAKEDDGMVVTVKAPEGALPAKSSIQAKRVNATDYQAAAEELMDGSMNLVLAVDITFFDARGNKIEPSAEVDVTVTAPEISDVDDPVVIHVPETSAPETIDPTDDGKLAVNQVAFASDSFSVYLIADGGGIKTPRVTYHFLQELKADKTADPFIFVNKAGNSVDYQIIKNDEKLDDVGSPVTTLERPFAGWYVVTKNGDTYTMMDTRVNFTPAEPPVKPSGTADQDVYVAPRYGTAHIVTFWDSPDGSSENHILAKRLVVIDEGATTGSVRVDDIPVPTTSTTSHTAWFSRNYADSPVTYTLTEKSVWDQVKGDCDLYPVLSEGHWLRFQGGEPGSGAGYRSAIFVTANTTAADLAQLGTVARDGYTFAGWYYGTFDGQHITYGEAATDASGAASNAADLLNRVQNSDGDLTLYGNWTGNEVNYRIAIWQENPDDDDYSFAKVLDSADLKATAGSTLTVAEILDKVNADAVSQKAGFHRYGTGDYAAVETDADYQLKDTVISGKGNTVINVYFNRDVYDVEFYKPVYVSGTTDDYNIGLIDGKYVELTKGTVTKYYYNGTEYTGDRYSTSSNDYDNDPVKYGETDSSYNGWTRVELTYYSGYWYYYNNGSIRYYNDYRYILDPDGSYGFDTSRGFLRLTSTTETGWFTRTRPSTISDYPTTYYYDSSNGTFEVTRDGGTWYAYINGEWHPQSGDLSAGVYTREEYTGTRYKFDHWQLIPKLTISEKYGKDIHDQWPGVKEGTEDYSTAWYVHDIYDENLPDEGRYVFVTSITVMHLDGAKYYEMPQGNDYVDTVFMIQNTDGSNNFTPYLSTPQLGSNSSWTTADDYRAIKGFRLNAASEDDAAAIRGIAGGDEHAVYNSNFKTSAPVGTKLGDGVMITHDDGHTYSTLYFYYLRNAYDVVFEEEGGPAVSDLTGVYYQANIADAKADGIAAVNSAYVVDQTTKTVTGEGDYVFKGWYSNAAYIGDPFDFNTEMPANNVVLYAKWEPVEYLMKINPTGGEILPNISESTYTWLKYGQKLERYNITRPYVEAEAGYIGQKYYLVEVLADNDPNVNATSGAFSSMYRKVFYIKAEDINNPEYAFWKVHNLIHTDVVYKRETPTDYYSFVGWYDEATDKVYDFSNEITGPTSIYASWRRSGLFHVQYDCQNGPVTGSISGTVLITDHNYADQAETMIMYRPDGITSTDGNTYVFKGWKLADDDSATPTIYQQGDAFTVEADHADASHVIHLVAVYETVEASTDPAPVTKIVFDPNFPTGAGSTSGERKTVEGIPLNTRIDLAAGSFTITRAGQSPRTETIPAYTCYGYVMTGWNTKADGTGTSFKLDDVVGVDNLVKDEGNTEANTLYAVWEVQYFYIFHSGTKTLQAVPMTDCNEQGVYNLVAQVDSVNYRYGGYYKTYGGWNPTDAEMSNAKTFAKNDENMRHYLEAATSYDGSKLKMDNGKRFWTKTDAYSAAKNDDPGNAMHPVADTVYYVKEVPVSYLTSRVQYVYDWSDGNKLVNFYLLTAVDDNYYQGVYFNVVTSDKSPYQARLANSFSVMQRNTNKKVTTTAADFGLSRAYVGYSDTTELIKVDTTFTMTPYWVTLDGVTVNGAARSFNFGDGTNDSETGLHEVEVPNP